MIKFNIILVLLLFLMSNIVSQTPKAHWTFNHGNEDDETGSGINGIVTDISFYRGLDCDTGAYFNGSTSAINFGNNLNDVFTDGTFSICLWVKPYSYSSNDKYKDLSMIIQKWFFRGKSK